VDVVRRTRYRRAEVTDMASASLHPFYTVNDRPVKFVPTEGGGLDVQVLDMRTGEFVRDMSYLSKVFEPGKDVDQLSEAEFNARVDAIRREIASRG
jgi:hypothetical protein